MAFLLRKSIAICLRQLSAALYQIRLNMISDRIYFKDNPWPEGHPIKEFVMSAKVVDGDVWINMHLKSADYYAERDIEDDEDLEYPSDWAAPIVWGNYHSCTLSSNYWHEGGFKLCKKSEYTPEFLDGLELSVDDSPEDLDDFEELSFHIYLLGHDAVAKHKIRFERLNDTMQFKVVWTGKIAQAYVGDYEFNHDFSATVSATEFPTLQENDA